MMHLYLLEIWMSFCQWTTFVCSFIHLLLLPILHLLLFLLLLFSSFSFFSSSTSYWTSYSFFSCSLPNSKQGREELISYSSEAWHIAMQVTTLCNAYVVISAVSFTSLQFKSLHITALHSTLTRGWREPGNETLQRGRIFLLVLFKKRVPDQEGRPAGHWHSRAGAGKRFLVLFRIIEQDQELVQNSFKSIFFILLKTVINQFCEFFPYVPLWDPGFIKFQQE